MSAEHIKLSEARVEDTQPKRADTTLKRRLGFIPLVDLADCVNVSHRAVGSPHFNERGEPLGFDPLITIMVGDLLDARLPHATTIISPSSTRPLFTTDPRARELIEAANPERHRELKRALEGRLSGDEIRRVTPGDLLSSVSSITLVPFGGSRPSELQRFARGVARAVSSAPRGATARIPAPQLGDPELDRRALTSLIDALIPVLTRGSDLRAVRRVLIISPERSHAQSMLNLVMERALKLSLIDRLTDTPLTPRLSYGISSFPNTEITGDLTEDLTGQLIDQTTLTNALMQLDESLDLIARGEPDQALLSAQQLLDRSEGSVMLSEIYVLIHELTQRAHGVSHALADELTRRVSWGELDEASALAHVISRPPFCDEVIHFARDVIEQVHAYDQAECLALMAGEEYTRARDQARHVKASRGVFTKGEHGQDQDRYQDQNQEPESERGINLREVSDTIRFICDRTLIYLNQSLTSPSSQSGEQARSLSQSLIKNLNPSLIQELNGAVFLEALTMWVSDATTSGDRRRDRSRARARHKRLQIATRLDEIIATAPPELARSLKPRCELIIARSRLAFSMTSPLPRELLSLWGRLNHALAHSNPESPERHSAIGYLTLITLMRGPKLIGSALRLIRLWSQLIESELNTGTYGERALITHEGVAVTMPMNSPAVQRARRQLEGWRDWVQLLLSLAQGLARDELSYDLAIDRYNRLIDALKSLGREHLALAYQRQLSEEWLSRFIARGSSPIKSAIASVLGETIADLLLIIWRFVKRLRYAQWRLFSRRTDQEISSLLNETLTEIERRITLELTSAD